ncbi:hypothetical protein CW745_10295 [Psychromonas sp. psych-6C06]|uniref:hypothetical protein n=1 Tax=Psychromonas sp. psych-6C06 TaxID=2058089 RepID=UPI000C344731|nr:hypothetical protein [Psychromonas sp. psych-6C06]PKF61701.1 hypothetical protein CW745_10295 [Psychromonas sp. psych-6C06]
MYKLFLTLLLISFSPLSNANVAEISAGSTLKMRVAEQVDSRVRQPGYKFRITLDSDIVKEGKTLLKSGATGQAMISEIQRSGKGLDAPAIIVTLHSITINKRAIKAESFPVAGKGKSQERSTVGENRDDEEQVVSRQGQEISATIPVITRNYDISISEGNVIYFILKSPIKL